MGTLSVNEAVLSCFNWELGSASALTRYLNLTRERRIYMVVDNSFGITFKKRMKFTAQKERGGKRRTSGGGTSSKTLSYQGREHLSRTMQTCEKDNARACITCTSGEAREEI